MFKETHPILGTRDIQRAIAFYTQQLGFKLAFGDKADPPNYVGFQRDAVELHMQFQFEHEMETIRLRFLVQDPDALFSEYRQRGVECNPNSVHDTSWGTREFALYDFDRNALTSRDLTSAEKEGRCPHLCLQPDTLRPRQPARVALRLTDSVNQSSWASSRSLKR